MPADQKIHYLSPDGGIEPLISRLFSDLAADPLHTYLIAPTKTLANSIQERLDQESLPYVPDQITTMNGFCKYHTRHDMTGVYVLSSDEAMAILGVLFDAHKASFPLLGAYHRSTHIRQLFRFFGELTKHATPFPECFHGSESEKIKELAQLYEIYNEHLRKHYYVDEYGILDHTRKRIIQTQGQIKTIYFFALFDLSPVEQDLIWAICEHAEKVDYTIPSGLDTAIFNPDTHSSFLFTPNIISDPEKGENYGFTGLFGPIDMRKEIPKLIKTPIYSTICAKGDKGDKEGRREEEEKEYVIDCATKTEEIRYIAKEITRLCAHEVMYTEITIAFPDPREILPFLEMVFEEYHIPFHTSQTLPFSSHPFSQFCIDILTLIEQDLSYQTLFPIVMSPYFTRQKLSGKWLDLLMRWNHLEQITDDDTKFLREKIENGEDFLSLHKEKLLNTLDAYVKLKNTVHALKGKKTALEHAEAVITFIQSIIDIEHIYDENARIKEIYGQFCTYLRNSIFIISAYEPNITLEQYCSYTRQYIDQAPLPGTTQKGITVLGFRELAYETCPYLFLAGLNEGAIPHPTTRHPFTTNKETKEIGILKQEDIMRVEQYYFISALCAGKKAIYLSALNDESKNWIESPFFDQVVFNCHPMRWQSDDQEDDPCPYDTTTSEGLDLALRIEIEQQYRVGLLRSKYDGIISQSPYIEQYLADRFGSDAHWSISRLETYAHCPFRFWIEHVLHIEPLEDVTQKHTSAEYGILVHQILCEFYEILQQKGLLRLTSEHTEEILSTLDEITTKYLLEQKQWLSERKAQIGTLIGTRYTGIGSLRRFIHSEIAYQDTSKLHMPTHFEFAFGGLETDETDIMMNISVDLAPDGEDQMLLHGIIDRIDYIGDQYFGIIDYKTGAVPELDDILSGLSLQLPLYMHAYQMLSGKMGIYGSYIRFKGNDVKGTTPLYHPEALSYIPYLSPRQKKITCDELMQIAMTQARQHISDMRCGYFPITAREECPDTWCPYRSICRYDKERGSESKIYTLV
ncbi:MAG: PD-(D/E)XK nuclease family protein [Methanomicrobiales archaeon]|jgi:ATP-dependent helicase/DNAse subunit B|nr:PD-(D/E)XK nuclease family protein [Methanomicrobiales archaeon]